MVDKNMLDVLDKNWDIIIDRLTDIKWNMQYKPEMKELGIAITPRAEIYTWENGYYPTVIDENDLGLGYFTCWDKSNLLDFQSDGELFNCIEPYVDSEDEAYKIVEECNTYSDYDYMTYLKEKYPELYKKVESYFMDSIYTNMRNEVENMLINKKEELEIGIEYEKEFMGDC